MEQDEIIVGEEYAYLIPNMPGPHQPIRAIVDHEPSGGYVQVTLYHPDSGQSDQRVKTREIVGRWSDEPEERFTQHHAAVKQAKASGGQLSWATVASTRYGEVQRQRALAARLTSLGIVRAGRDYAGSGGNSRKLHDTDLQLNHNEIEFLLDRIERGPTATTPVSSPLPPGDEGVEP